MLRTLVVLVTIIVALGFGIGFWAILFYLLPEHPGWISSIACVLGVVGGGAFTYSVRELSERLLRRESRKLALEAKHGIKVAELDDVMDEFHHIPRGIRVYSKIER